MIHFSLLVPVDLQWVSVTLGVLVESAEQLYTIYEVIDKDERVKFKF